MYVYQTAHEISQTICQAIHKGVPSTLLDINIDGDWDTYRFGGGPAITYGNLRGAGEIVRLCEALSLDYYYVDHGYMNRGHFNGHYRITKNALQSTQVLECPPDRFEQLNIKVQEWKRGDKILVIPLSIPLATFLGIDAQVWLDYTIGRIKRTTDREIVVKGKDGSPLLPYLDNCHALVTHSSNAAVDGVIAGVPAFSTYVSGVSPVALSDLSKIEDPIYPDRRQWLYSLAYQQFTLEEFSNGTAWSIVKEMPNG